MAASVNLTQLGMSPLIPTSTKCTQVSVVGHMPSRLSFISCSARTRLKQERFTGKSMVTNVSGRLVGERGPGVLERPGLGGGGGGTGVLERPGFDQSQFEATPSAEEGGEIGKVREKRGTGGGDRYKVLLLDHERHTESQVAAVLPKVVPSVTPDEARRCFHESRQTGAGLVTVTVKEHAEFYAQMMARSGLRSTIEPDGDLL